VEFLKLTVLAVDEQPVEAELGEDLGDERIGPPLDNAYTRR
jgi:hypothetical protein